MTKSFIPLLRFIVSGLDMKGYRAAGSFKDNNKTQRFSIEIAAEDADKAKEKVLSTLGSRHKLKRWEIKLDEVSEIAVEEITDPVVTYLVGEE
jgi:large subunit ribosomal protein LX